MPGYGPGNGYGGMDGFGNTGGSQSGENSGNKGDTSTDTSPIGEMTGVVDGDGNPVGYGERNSLGNFTGTVMSSNPAFGQNQRNLARSLNALQMDAIRGTPSLGMGDYSPSTMGGLNATDGLSFGESLGYSGAQLGEALGAMSPGSIMGGIMGLAAGLPPGLGSIFGGLFGSEDSEDSADKKSLFDKFGDLDFSDFFGPAETTVEQGGNRIPVVEKGPDIDAMQALIDDLISRGFSESLAQRIVDSGKYFASYD